MQAFSSLVVTKWQSGLEEKQPELTGGLGLLQGRLETASPKREGSGSPKGARGWGIREPIP